MALKGEEIIFNLRTLVTLSILCLVIACNTSERILPTPVVIPTPTSEINRPTESATNSSSSTPEPPVFSGTPYPEPVATIAGENVHQIQQLAYLDKGRMNQAIYSPDGRLIAVASSTGIFLYDAKTLEQVRFSG